MQRDSKGLFEETLTWMSQRGALPRLESSVGTAEL